jgi:hypothetical protein
VGGGDGDGGDGGGFGAEDSGAEGDGRPCVLGKERHLFGGPAAFGAYGEGEVGGLLGWWRVYIPPIAVRLRWMGHSAFYIPPIAMRLRWMGHPSFGDDSNEMRGFFPFGKLRIRMTIQFPSMGGIKIF